MLTTVLSKIFINQGDVKLFNINSGAEEAAYACHESAVYHLQPNKDCSLLLTSSR